MTEKRASDMDTGVPHQGSYLTVSFFSESPGQNVYQDELFPIGEFQPVDVVMWTKDPLETSVTTFF